MFSISIHAPSRERLSGKFFFSGTPSLDFNPRSLAGATLIRIDINANSFQFQSTLPRGSDSRSNPTNIRQHIFQSTLPRGSDSLHSKFSFSVQTYFNPRSLAGATGGKENGLEMDFISIHAPSRERLVRPDLVTDFMCISIHAPSRERLDHQCALQPCR